MHTIIHRKILFDAIGTCFDRQTSTKPTGCRSLNYFLEGIKNEQTSNFFELDLSVLTENYIMLWSDFTILLFTKTN